MSHNRLTALLYSFPREDTASYVEEILTKFSCIRLNNTTDIGALLNDGIVLDLIIIYSQNPMEVLLSCCSELKKQSRFNCGPITVLGRLPDDPNRSSLATAGVSEFINWPIDQSLFKEKIDTLIQQRKYQIDVESRARELAEEIAQTQNATIEAIAALVECKDDHTGKHIHRTKAYIEVLADEMTRQGIYADELTDNYKDLVIKTSPLHDIGKVGIADEILTKPGKHDAEEFFIMKQHTVMGGEALEKAMERSAQSPFLKCAQQIAYYHHEKWDGSGYPENLSGSNIPLCARLMAVADVYDAARNKRVYKDPKPHDMVVEEMESASGSHFDPTIIAVFLSISDKFRHISEQPIEMLE